MLLAPPAGTSQPAGIARDVAQFTWLLAEAQRHNIAVYLGTNVECSACGHAGPRLPGPDTRPASNSLADLFAAYPALAGLLVHLPEDQAGDSDLLARTLVPAIKAAASKRTSDGAPALLVDTRHLSIDQIRRVLRACPAARLVAPLQPTNTFEPAVDSRLLSLLADIAVEPGRRSTPPVSLVGLVAPQPAERYLFVGTPAWMHALTLDARRHGLDGLVCSDEESWLAGEALAAYAVNMPDSYNPRRWQQRIEEACGLGSYAPQLLETIQNASAIVPALVNAVDGRSDLYMPQMGMPLVNYAEFPSRQPIRDLDGGADDILGHVQACESLLPTLTHIVPENPRQQELLKPTLDQLQLTVALGRYSQLRLRAVSAWARLRAGTASVKEFQVALHRSVESWPPVVLAASKTHPDPVEYGRCVVVSQPPWLPRQILDGFEPVIGRWSDHSAILQRESEIVSRIPPDQKDAVLLPLWDRLIAQPEGRASVTTRVSFDKPLRDRRYDLGPGASITVQKELILKGKGSLLVDTRSLGPGPHVVLLTHPEFVTLTRNRPHQISIMYRVIERASDAEEPFELGAVLGDGTEFGVYRRWNAPAGCTDGHYTQVPPLPRENAQVYLKVYGSALLVVDNLVIAETE